MPESGAFALYEIMMSFALALSGVNGIAETAAVERVFRKCAHFFKTVGDDSFCLDEAVHDGDDFCHCFHNRIVLIVCMICLTMQRYGDCRYVARFFPFFDHKAYDTASVLRQLGRGMPISVATDGKNHLS